MSMILSSLKEEKTNEEIYNAIIGSEYIGRSNEELFKDMESKLSDSYTSRTERKEILNLMQRINYQNEQH